MQITPTNLTFSKLNKRQSTSRIVIHHSASADVSAAEIHRWHRNRGFAGIGYHYLIRSDGSIEAGRPLDSIGAHAGSEGNFDSIGICLTGNFENHLPSVEQIDSLVELIRYLNSIYQKELAVIGHKDVNSTACPGQYFPWLELRSKLTIPQWQQDIIQAALANKLISQWHNPEDYAPKWFVLAVVLNMMKESGSPTT